MSTTFDAETLSPRLPHVGPAEPPPVDPEVVQQTRQEIRTLIEEIARLAESSIPLAEFCSGLLSRVVSALAAEGAALWRPTSEGGWALAHRVNDTLERCDSSALQRHALLLRHVARSQQAVAAPPKTGVDDDLQAGNPTSQLLLIVPVLIDDETAALIEIFQRPDVGPAPQRGYLRFLLQMAALAAGYLRNQRLRELAEREALWRKLERLLLEVHRSLDLEATAHALANETRNIVECDRVSVGMVVGSAVRLLAVSGLETIDRRANQVRLLEELASANLKTGDCFWHSGDEQDLAPQIAEPLQRYVDESHTRAIGLIPLLPPAVADEGTPQAASPLAVLMVESLTNASWSDVQVRRTEAIVQHAAPAMMHALQYDRIFLRTLWERLGHWRTALRTKPKWLWATVGGAVAAALLLLTALPVSFDIAARGQLQPSQRWEVFAPAAGTITEVRVHHGERVEAGQLLVQLANADLDVQLTELMGRRRVANEQLEAAQRALLESGRAGKPQLSPGEENRLSSEVLQLRQSLSSIGREIELVRAKQESLAVKAEHAGEVVTWQVDSQLLRRPVQAGQALLTVANPAGSWEVELSIPERRLVHLDRAQRSAPQPLLITFMLSSQPGQEYRGRLVELKRTVESREGEGNVLLARVALEPGQDPPLHSGASVSAKVHCGSASLGYVWFCDLIETIQTHVLFWL